MLKLILTEIFVIFFFTSTYSQNNENKSNADSGILYLGVLETKHINWPESNYQAKKDSTSKKIVRVLFYKSKNEWKTLEKEISNPKIYPTQCTWFIAFDGKQIGGFQSSFEPLRFKEYPWTYPRDAYHKTIQKNLPTIGLPTTDFAGWTNEKQPRPLVVVSKPNCTDPENWKPFFPSQNYIKTIFPIYKEYISRFIDTSRLDISKMTYLKSYKSIKLDKLIQIGHLNKNIVNNEEFISYPIWIYISNSGNIKNLTKMIDYEYILDDGGDDDFSTSILVDAGDYDSNGKSELIFWSSRYNGDGYVLFFNEFENMIDFTWSYH